MRLSQTSYTITVPVKQPSDMSDSHLERYLRYCEQKYHKVLREFNQRQTLLVDEQ